MIWLWYYAQPTDVALWLALGNNMGGKVALEPYKELGVQRAQRERLPVLLLQLVLMRIQFQSVALYSSDKGQFHYRTVCE